MKATTIDPEGFESTYALIVRSEEKERTVSETAIYLLLIMTMVFSIWQSVQQPVTVPTNLLMHTSSVAESTFVEQLKA